MLLINWRPKQTKFKRLHKGLVRPCQYKKTAVRPTQGSIGLISTKSGLLSSKELEQVRRKLIILKKKRQKQKIWFRCLPDIPVTRKPLGIRMGKGKGTPKLWISRLIAGSIILQLSHMSKRRAKKGLFLAKKLLPIPTKIVYNKVFASKLATII